MSDFAEGWVVWGATRAALRDALAAERQRAFITRTSRPLLVFPRSADAVERISARLRSATLLAFSAGDDHGEVRVVVAGRVAHRVKTAGRLHTRAQVEDASELVRAVARRLRRAAGAVQRGSAVPRAIFNALGVDYDRASYSSFESLVAERTEVDPRSPPDLAYVDESGAEEAYAIAFRPVSSPRRARKLALDVDAPPDALLDAMRRLDPRRGDADARASLEALARRAATGSRGIAVREAAASLLSRSLDALGDDEQRAVASRLARDLVNEPDAATRAMLALALRRVGHLARRELEEALTKELDPAAARRAYEALHGLAHEPSDDELLERTRSERTVDRKGAYALLEQSVSLRTLRTLERCLETERDDGARELLRVVLARRRAELEE